MPALVQVHGAALAKVNALRDREPELKRLEAAQRRAKRNLDAAYAARASRLLEKAIQEDS